MTFPKDHRTRLHSTNPLERLNKEIKRRTHVVGIFPNQNAIFRLVGALMLEPNDEWAVTRRYMTPGTIDEVGKHQTVDVAKNRDRLTRSAELSPRANFTPPRGDTTDAAHEDYQDLPHPSW